ncbi:Uncharacterised protein [uncultured archaeon]|nr:Uncharacterised protein [uncultured archaeon]
MKALAALAVILILVFAGCAGTAQPPAPPANNSSQAANNVTNNTQIPNPASKFCVDAGYRNEIRGGPDGQVGYCIFKNGRECEEWAFYRGQCTDADSFSVIQSPGFVAHPKSIEYKYYADGRLTLTETNLSEGGSSTLTAWLTPAEFAAFIKKIEGKGFESFNSSYTSCGGNGLSGCPTDMPSLEITLVRQGSVKTIHVYQPAERPAALDEIVLGFERMFEANEFVAVDVSGCTLMKSAGGQFGCFGAVKGISHPVKTTAPEGYAAVENNSDGMLGSCTVGADGACAYLPPAQMTQKFCETARGHWQECGSACRGAPEGTACTLQCVQYCECGGIAGFGCPSGYFCGDYLPAGAGVADAMGICKVVQ